MAVSNNTVTHFNGNSAISFSALQTTFGGTVNSVKFSTYKRNTDLDVTDPIVPDSTENANISDSNSNLRASDFRGSIKQYILTQTSSDQILVISSQSWNSNLAKNVIKTFQVNGTLEATTTSNVAGGFSAEAYNMRLSVTGNIYGIGGAGGVANDGDGSPGGDALYVDNTSNRSKASAKIAINVNANGRIWAGGGGGGAGGAGNAGDDLSCFTQSTVAKITYSGGTTNPGRACKKKCPDTENISGQIFNLASNGICIPGTKTTAAKTGGAFNKAISSQRNRCRGSQERGQTCTNKYVRNCIYQQNFNVDGGGPGNGGNGGDGEGANNNAGTGNSGNSGNTTNCAATEKSSTGNSGNSGVSGGTWGQAGGNAQGQGGAAGRAIFRINGNTYNVSGANSNNVKGAFNP